MVEKIEFCFSQKRGEPRKGALPPANCPAASGARYRYIKRTPERSVTENYQYSVLLYATVLYSTVQ